MDQDQEIKYQIMRILTPHIGFESRIPRKLLLRELNRHLPYAVSDRRMRNLIEELRITDQGKYICASTGAKGGYFIAADNQELDQFTTSDLNRARAIFKRVATQRKLAKLDSSPQIRMF